MTPVRSALGVFLVLLIAAGCGSSAARITAKELPTLVLQPRDLPAAFERFDEGAQVSLDRVPGPRYDTSRFGRAGGWKARYQRPGTTSTRGPLVVESRADVFAHSSGARDDLAAYRDQFVHSVGAHLLRAPALGDEAVAMTQLRPGTPGTRYYSIAWRTANATGSVTANGFDGRFTFAQALALARAAERHMARAAV
jgi:hypothetical protein